MQKRKLLSGFASIAALAMLVVGASVPSVSAVVASDTQTTDTTTVQSEDGTTGDTTSSETPLKERVNAAREKAKEKVAAAREKRQTQTEEKRQLVCEKRQGAINNKIAAFTKAADVQMGHLDTVYTKLADYQSSNNVTVGNYSDLTTAADTKKQAAMDAIDELKAVATDVDCTNPDVAVTLTTVKDTAQVTRQALRDYRASLHDILVALAQATGTDTTTGDTTDTTTDGGTQ